MPATLSSWESGSLACALLLAAYLYGTRANFLYPLPPGPKKLPLVGNLLDIPVSYPWKAYKEWGRKYNSDILHLNAAGQSIIVLNSYDDAKELLVKRSSIYSSRPRSIMLLLAGFGFQFGMMPYGEPWRVRRRLFKKHFHPSNPVVHQVQEIKYIHNFLLRLLETPASLTDLLQHMIGSIALSITYDVDIQPENDPNMEIARQATQAFGETIAAGPKIVDLIPALQYLPHWFPGASFQRRAASTRIHAEKLRDAIFDEAYEKWSTRASPEPSLISLSLEDCRDGIDAEQLDIIKDVAGNVYMASFDSTSAALRTFILAMTCYPDVQRRVQQELDSVFKGERLPTHSDIPLMPYLSAVIKETLRWHAFVPTGVAHNCTEADVYKGYYIPKDSMVICNAWAMLNNESDYPKPKDFLPERFLDSDGQLRIDEGVRNPEDIVFGFGRRVCPGAHIGLSMLWMTAASLLSVFNIEKAVDADGRPVEPKREFTSGVVSHPVHFECSIKPRSRAAIALISETVVDVRETE